MTTDELDARILAQLAGHTDRAAIGKALGICQPELSTAIWRLRGQRLVAFDADRLTAKGRKQVGQAVAANRATPIQPNTQGGSGTARKASGAASSGAAKSGSASPPIDGQGGGLRPRPGHTLTRSPSEILRRIGREIDLEDPRKAMATMVQLWPEAARRLQAVAQLRGSTLETLLAEAITAGVGAIEKEIAE